MYNGTDKYGGKIVGESHLSDQLDEEGYEDPGFDSVEYSANMSSIDETLVCERLGENGEKIPGVMICGLDPENGTLRWMKDPVDVRTASARTIARSQMSSMLHDHVRNQAYQQGIRSVIERFTKENGRKPVVLDIGTGTGLLALMAAEAGAEKVYACEMFEAMSQIAQEVVIENKKSDVIKIIPKRSTTISVGKEMAERADILVTEIFDSILLGEGAIPSILHAKENLLTPNAKIVPSNATVYAQLIECLTLKTWLDLPSKEMEIRYARSSDAETCRGNGIAYPVHAARMEYKTLTDPIKIFDFNFQELSEAQQSLSHEISLKTQSGVVHGVLFWWDLQLDFQLEKSQVEFQVENKESRLCTIPGTNWWQDHWTQAIFPLEEFSTKSHCVLTCLHNELQIWFEAKPVQLEINLKVENPPKKPKFQVELTPDTCHCGLHLLCNYERTWMLGDPNRTSTFKSAILKALEILGEDALVLDISDGSMCAILAAVCGSTNVVSLESSEVSEMVFQQIVESNGVEDHVMIHAMQPQDLDEDILGGKIKILCAEPFYYQMQNYTLVQCLSFWYRRTCLENILDEAAMIIPGKAILRGVAVQLENLYEGHGKAGSVSGFSHAPFDALMENWNFNEFSYPLWQYKYQEVSDRFDIAEMDLCSPITDLDFQVEIQLFKLKTKCHAVVTWVDYHLTDDIVVSTSHDVKYWKSSVRFLDPPLDLENGGKTLQVEFKLEKSPAKFSLKVTPRE